MASVGPSIGAPDGVCVFKITRILRGTYEFVAVFSMSQFLAVLAWGAVVGTQRKWREGVVPTYPLTGLSRGLERMLRNLTITCVAVAWDLCNDPNHLCEIQKIFRFLQIVLQICRFFANLQIFCAFADILHIC